MTLDEIIQGRGVSREESTDLRVGQKCKGKTKYDLSTPKNGVSRWGRVDYVKCCH